MFQMKGTRKLYAACVQPAVPLMVEQREAHLTNSRTFKTPQSTVMPHTQNKVHRIMLIYMIEQLTKHCGRICGNP